MDVRWTEAYTYLAFWIPYNDQIQWRRMAPCPGGEDCALQKVNDKSDRLSAVPAALAGQL